MRQERSARALRLVLRAVPDRFVAPSAVAIVETVWSGAVRESGQSRCRREPGARVGVSDEWHLLFAKTFCHFAFK